jgi:hypothetical protein
MSQTATHSTARTLAKQYRCVYQLSQLFSSVSIQAAAQQAKLLQMMMS